MDLSNALCPGCIAAGLEADSKSAVLREVARLAKASSVLADVSQETILAGLEHREELGSTGFGEGIAIPHCRLRGVREFVVGLLTVPKGVDFDAIDGRRVRLVVFIVAPEANSAQHIRLLSSISHVLSDRELVEELVAAETTDRLRELFESRLRGELRPVAEEGCDLFHVFVQNEDLFHDILRIFAGIPSCSTAVVQAERAGAHLVRVPLFADLWTNETNTSVRIIVATVGKRVTNEAIRRIERITGPLRERSDVMVIVQETSYRAGALES